MNNVLDDVRVLELAQQAFVPSAGTILAEWGADVIKIEEPRRGDPIRGVSTWGLPREIKGFAVIWEISNAGKRSIGIDVNSGRGQDLIRGLLSKADVFLTNFRAPTLRKLHLDPEAVLSAFPKMVYGRGTAHGPVGPESDRGGFDILSYWSRAGVSASISPPEQQWPCPMPGPGFGDLQAGVALAGGISAALVRRYRTGVGGLVDVSLLSMGMWAMQSNIVGADLLGICRLDTPARDSPENPTSNVYRSSDGALFALGMHEGDRYWPALCDALGQQSLLLDERFSGLEQRVEHSAECTAVLTSIFASLSYEDIAERLTKVGCLWAPVQMPGDLVRDPQVIANRYVQEVVYSDGRSINLVANPVQFDRTPPTIRQAPAHASDTDSVLAEELGISTEELVDLKIGEIIT
jgi:crotonobetainyl-CoA:carnitine CoA-transferase CaiB-like acyl-CoA transferase